MSRDKQSLLDIADSVQLIMDYVPSWDQFTESVQIQDAVMRRLAIIGEATKRLSRQFRRDHPTIPWKEMAGLRDVIAHEYDGVDLQRLKSVIEVKLPEILR